MSAKSFKEFLLQEGLRQDAMVHNMAGQLGTKTRLMMIFAAFVFAAESAFVIVSLMFGLQLPKWGWGGSLFLSLASIGVLLRSPWLEKFKTIPAFPESRKQAEEFFVLDDIKSLSEDQQWEKFQEKFVDAVADCARDNLQANAKIAKNMKAACWLIAASTLCILGCLIWILF